MSDYTTTITQTIEHADGWRYLVDEREHEGGFMVIDIAYQDMGDNMEQRISGLDVDVARALRDALSTAIESIERKGGVGE